jgi:hypothetical protein
MATLTKMQKIEIGIGEANYESYLAPDGVGRDR